MQKTEDIDLIVNHPKKAINKLAIPIIISYLFMMMNNIIDGIWVSGLGPHPLAAVGFVTPLFLALVGFANGLGAGSNSLIARCIGAEDYHKAGNSAIHSIMLSIIMTVISTVVILLLLKPLLLMMGAGEVMSETMAYGSIVIGGIFSVFLPAMMAAIFRAQGEVKRASYPLILTAIINIILDPIFIYTLGLGVAGAALATVLAGALAASPMVYWMFIKQDSFLKVKMSEYKTDFSIYKDILVVGIPASLEQFIISFVSILMNYWLTLLGGTLAVAAYTATWRLVSIGMSPLIGIGVAALTVGGAAYGARNLVNLKTSLNYGIKLGMVSSIIISSFFFIFADPLSFIFSYSADSAVLASSIVEALRVLCFFILFMPFGVLAGNIFQSMGKGTTSLIITVLRSFIMEVIFAGLFAFIFAWGVVGVYSGLVCGMSVGSLVGYAYINYYLNKHRSYFED
ncbi:MAG: MATE family efflux transporter [Methanobrevibacter sp.]|uniref:MATE family efflux transporter n=1 Tax=Methanobrevibacter sp. TaxID=66852 RepID=UPI0025DDBF48|nr:MATE family efflux transporter [Methanobrevibacter sp.]MBQ6100128.1 MATE family efflux transporter [Methanobrevibacter sp.]